MELIEDVLRQDDLPLSCVFPAKANFQLGTPDAQGANRPSHSVCDFPITEALLDKDGNQLKQQFDELVHDESVAAETIEKIFDAEFHRRFAELISRVAGLSK